MAAASKPSSNIHNSLHHQPVAISGGQLLLFLKVTPNGSRNQIGEIIEDGDGAIRLRVTVTAPPEGGKANARLIKLLAKTWDLPKSSLTVVRGTKDRRKTVEIGGDVDMVLPILLAWLKEHGENS